jgi:hypothetical protein
MYTSIEFYTEYQKHCLECTNTIRVRDWDQTYPVNIKLYWWARDADLTNRNRDIMLEYLYNVYFSSFLAKCRPSRMNDLWDDLNNQLRLL